MMHGIDKVITNIN